MCDVGNQHKFLKGIENKVFLVVILGWTWLLTIFPYDTNVVYGSLTMGGEDISNEPNAPLRIKLMLEQDNQNPESYIVKNYTFEFNGLTQQPRNYALQQDGWVIVSPDQLNIILAPALEIENTTGTITEKDIHRISGVLPFDRTLEDSATGETTHFLDSVNNYLAIGDFDWTDVTGNVTTKGNQAIVSIEE